LVYSNLFIIVSFYTCLDKYLFIKKYYIPYTCYTGHKVFGL
jgi:hypothetical protein